MPVQTIARLAQAAATSLASGRGPIAAAGRAGPRAGRLREPRAVGEPNCTPLPDARHARAAARRPTSPAAAAAPRAGRGAARRRDALKRGARALGQRRRPTRKLHAWTTPPATRRRSPAAAAAPPLRAVAAPRPRRRRGVGPRDRARLRPRPGRVGRERDHHAGRRALLDARGRPHEAHVLLIPSSPSPCTKTLISYVAAAPGAARHQLKPRTPPRRRGPGLRRAPRARPSGRQLVEFAARRRSAAAPPPSRRRRRARARGPRRRARWPCRPAANPEIRDVGLRYSSPLEPPRLSSTR